jgi:hypothetical protein
MTVSSTTNREQYATDGVTTAFTIHFPFFEDDGRERDLCQFGRSKLPGCSTPISPSPVEVGPVER